MIFTILKDKQVTLLLIINDYKIIYIHINMKKQLFIPSLLVLLTSFTYTMNAQVVSQTVTINPGYTHQVYYSLPNGAFPAVDNTNWDIGFQLRGFAASITINSKNNVRLYRSMKSVADWSTMVTADTTGVINAGYELHNSDTTWNQGAFNNTNDATNQFDLGWGVYDFITHVVTGDSVYFIKLSNGNFKKFWIESLTSGVYYFRWADLDGTNETLASLTKSLYAGKYFAYFSIQNNVAIDREPIYNAWDMVFTQYLSLTPYIYKVAGVLTNDSVFATKAYPVNVNTVSPSGYPLSSKINTIGYDWKSYDFGTNSWTIEDSTVYFVQDHNAGLWKVIFTGFGGSANGVYNFTKEFLGTTGVSEQSVNPILSIYPNPTSGDVNLVVARQQKGKEAVITINNTMGQVLKSIDVPLSNELNNIYIDLNNLSQGIYFLIINQEGKVNSKTIVIQ